MKTGFKILLIFVSIFDSIRAQNFGNAIKSSVELIENFKSKESIPGIGVGVNFKGKHIWLHSSGYSDIENDVPFTKDSVIRTGSVSKAIETAVLAKIVEQNKVVWDHEIHKYVSEQHFPKKQWNGLCLLSELWTNLN